MTQLDFNLIDVDNLVNKFLLDRQSGLVTLHKIYFKNNHQVSYRAFVEELFEELKAGCVTFINKNNSIEDIETYLFYIANAFGKKQTIPIVKKNKEFICPGCLFLGKENLLSQEVQLICYDCVDSSKKATESKWLDFFNCFKKHSKVGFRCADCDRFIPQPLSKSTNIICPYIDCLFVGSSNDLKKMTHPNLDSKIKHVSIASGIQIADDEADVTTKIEIQQDLELKIKIIKEVIDQQSSAIYWNSFNFTIKHKAFVYQAFKNVLEKFPIEMTSYLLDASRSGGFQHKLFQEYISILESNLPIPYKKNKEIKSIQSLLDSELSLFDGMSVFDGEITKNCVIKNNTQEVYIGGRKASHVKPFYIGKLLNVVMTDTNEPIMHLVKDYSFSRIKLSEMPKSTKVTVTHLRVPPHYQMGGMVYVNRIRKKIIDKVSLLLENKNEVC
jgi:hypothetical protein